MDHISYKDHNWQQAYLKLWTGVYFHLEILIACFFAEVDHFFQLKNVDMGHIIWLKIRIIFASNSISSLKKVSHFGKKARE